MKHKIIITKGNARKALLVAAIVDGIQVICFPAFIAGDLSPFNLLVDAVASAWLCSILGFHPVLILALIPEGGPIVDEFPTWTLAALYVIKSRSLATPVIINRALPPIIEVN